MGKMIRCAGCGELKDKVCANCWRCDKCCTCDKKGQRYIDGHLGKHTEKR